MGSQRLSLPAKAPQFFKIIHSHIVQHAKLRIPKKFMRKYGKNLLDHVWLEVPSGAVWHVELVTSKGDVWLQRGWKEFAEHYSIGLWHFLVFRYEGKSRFHVIIFDMSASEIEYPVSERTNLDGEFGVGKEVIEMDGDDVQSLEDFPTCQTAREKSYHRLRKKTRTNSTSKMEECSRDASDGVQGEGSETEKARALQSAKAFKSRNPFFMITMRPSYVGDTYKLNIPWIFADKYFTKNPNKLKNTDVILQVSGRRTWSVKCNIPSHIAKLGLGWRMFAHDNYLKVGDICIFELINRTENLLNVVIFRAAKCVNLLNEGFEVGKESIQIDENQVERLEDFLTCQTTKEKSYHIHPRKKSKMEESARDASDGIQVSQMKHVKSEEGLSSLGYIGAKGKQTATNTEKTRALQFAKAFKSKYPFIMVTMRPSYVSGHGNLSIPRAFAKKYFTKKHGNVNVTLQVSDGRTWSVMCNIFTCNAKFGVGWRTFVCENCLALRDVCVFELINGIENLVNVVIFRAAKDANY